MTPGCNCPCPEGKCPKCDPPTTEQVYCEAVAREALGDFWMDSSAVHPPRHVEWLADLIARERAAAWLEGRNAGIDTARRVFDDIRAKDVAAARDQALEEAARKVCPLDPCAHAGCGLARRDIRALKVRP